MGREENPDGVQKTDQQLVLEVRSGNRSSYSELVKRHQKGLLRLSMRFVKNIEVAQDIVQEACIKAYEKLELFEGRSTFKSWLYQITVNVARNVLRENRRQFMDISDVDVAVGATAEAHLLHMSVGDILQKEIDLLPFKQKTSLVLRVYEDMSFAQIAEIMDCPYDTAKANYRHALLKLKEVFQTKVELRSWMNETSTFLTQVNSKFVEAE